MRKLPARTPAERLARWHRIKDLAVQLFYEIEHPDVRRSIQPMHGERGDWMGYTTRDQMHRALAMALVQISVMASRQIEISAACISGQL